MFAGAVKVPPLPARDAYAWGLAYDYRLTRRGGGDDADVIARACCVRAAGAEGDVREVQPVRRFGGGAHERGAVE